MNFEVDGTFGNVEYLHLTPLARAMRRWEDELAYVLSFELLLGFRPATGIVSCPAAMKSPSPKIF